MRVTFILPDVKFTTRSGGYRVHYEMANHLVDRRHQVVVVHKTNSRRVWLRSKLWPLLRHFTRHDFVPWFKLSPQVRLLVSRSVNRRTVPGTDVFVFTDWKTTLDWPSVGGTAPAVVLVWDYEFWAEGDDELRAAMRDAFAQPGLVLVAGSVAVETMLASMGLVATATIPPGIDHEIFHQTRDVSGRGKTIGFLNRPGPRRGMPEVLEAIALASETDGQMRVIVAGQPGTDLPPWAELRSTPSDDDLAAFYNELAVFVLPSHAEGLGLPALEAMACGAAVVVTDNGGSRQFARDGYNSLVVPPRDAPAMSAAIIRLLSDDSLRERVAQAGAETAATYTWDHAADALEQVLVRAVGQEDEREATQM